MPTQMHGLGQQGRMGQPGLFPIHPRWLTPEHLGDFWQSKKLQPTILRWAARRLMVERKMLELLAQQDSQMAVLPGFILLDLYVILLYIHMLLSI